MTQYAGVTNRVLSWNCKVGRPPGDVMDALATFIKDKNPDVICLQEAGGYVDNIRNRFGDKWWVYAHYDWDESAMCPVMTKKADYNKKNRGQKDGWDTLRTTTTWTGPQGGKHKGRTWTWVKCSGLWVMSLHRCTDGDGKNKAAFAEEHDKLVKWIGNHYPCLIIGDNNVGSGKDYPNSSRDIAQDAKGGIDASGTIDYAIQKSANGTIATLKKRGSDHEAILWTLGS